MVVTVATEGIVDTAVAKRILSSLRLEVGAAYGERGKPWLDRRLQSYNQAARHAPWAFSLLAHLVGSRLVARSRFAAFDGRSLYWRLNARRNRGA